MAPCRRRLTHKPPSGGADIASGRNPAPAARGPRARQRGKERIALLLSLCGVALALAPTGAARAASPQARYVPDEVATAEPNRLARIDASLPNDPGARLQWNFFGPSGIDLTLAWKRAAELGAPGGRGVVVAVLDTGVAYTDRGIYRRAPDLRRVVPGYDFVGGDRYPIDSNGHGTHVAGTIAEAVDNGIGATGIAYEAAIMPVKVLDARGSGDAATIARGIRWATRKGADVINLSLEFPASVTARDIPDVVSAIDAARRRGVVVTAAAGNVSSKVVPYPARANGVIAVGATTEDGCRAAYSNGGADLDVVAPGGGADAAPGADAWDRSHCARGRSGRSIFQQTIVSARYDFGLPAGYTGTSMASPHVAGLAALIIASKRLGPSPSSAAVEALIERTARDAGPPGFDPAYGNGLIDAGAALGATPPPPAVARTAASSSSRPVVRWAKGRKCVVSVRSARAVEKVEFFLRGKRVGADRQAPFRCSWRVNGAQPGTYAFTARATDVAGGVASARKVIRVGDHMAGLGGRVPIGTSASLRDLSGGELRDRIAELRAAGMEYSREDLEWDTVATDSGELDWSRYDELVLESARQGLGLILIPDSPPASVANDPNTDPPTGGQDLDDYAAFVKAAVARYGSRGTLWDTNPDVPRKPVLYWDIWNEPYMTSSWGPGDPDGGEYARMYKAAVAAGREADPEARFMFEADTGANTGRWPQTPWFEQAFAAVPDLATYVDAVSIHPYTSEVDPARCTPGRGSLRTFWHATRFQFCRVRDVRRILDAHGLGDAPVWITELGWPTSGERSVDEPTQARYVATAFRLLRQWRVVDGLVWYHYMTSERGEASGDWFGFVHPDGSPKPAWNELVDQTRAGLRN
jgi:serine protease